MWPDAAEQRLQAYVSHARQLDQCDAGVVVLRLGDTDTERQPQLRERDGVSAAG